MNSIQKKIANRFMRMTIVYHVSSMIKNNPRLTVDDVIAEIKEEALNTLCSSGFTIEEIKETIEDAIKKCKK